jgi:hypothetical protein
MKSTGEYPGSIGNYDANQKFNITNCFFKNISSSHNSPRGGAIYCNMNNNINIGYYVSGNTFIEIKTNKSAIQLNGSFSSLIFTSNSFFNVSSIYEGGVFKFNKYIYCFFI